MPANFGPGDSLLGERNVGAGALLERQASLRNPNVNFRKSVSTHGKRGAQGCNSERENQRARAVRLRQPGSPGSSDRIVKTTARRLERTAAAAMSKR